jgi:hypothetical protein
MRRWPIALCFVISIVALTAVTLNAQTDIPDGQTAAANLSRLRGFVITLALGDVRPGSSPGTFTPAAAKALADMKDFLPYKSYRPLDTIWLIGLSWPHQTLEGVDGQKHELYMRVLTVSPTAVKVDMLRLWDAAPATPQKMPAPPLIDTSFTIKVGETVVVGTSRLDGGRALILLVTAAAR